MIDETLRACVGFGACFYLAATCLIRSLSLQGQGSFLFLVGMALAGGGSFAYLLEWSAAAEPPSWRLIALLMGGVILVMNLRANHTDDHHLVSVKSGVARATVFVIGMAGSITLVQHLPEISLVKAILELRSG
jgi:hypothetical protein